MYNFQTVLRPPHGPDTYLLPKLTGPVTSVTAGTAQELIIVCFEMGMLSYRSRIIQKLNEQDSGVLVHCTSYLKYQEPDL